MAMTLVEFLEARIAEDEDAAKAVNRSLWTSRVALLQPDLYGHIVRQHPARVLAECEAKRRIVLLHEDEHACESSDAEGVNFWSTASGSERLRVDEGPWIRFESCQTLRLLALPYAGHPDYREEFRP